MADRSNACSELTRFWLEARHGFLVRESLPVRVPYGLSDLDLVAIHPRRSKVGLPDGAGTLVGPRLIVETKDEHDFDPLGKAFGASLCGDVAKMQGGRWVPAGTPNVKFSMLRQQHYEAAEVFFGGDDFDRLFVVHALDSATRQETQALFAKRRVYWVSIKEVVADLLAWYPTVERKAALRHTLPGDLFHLLVGYCNLKP
jgi:hypothetical protein